MYDGLFANFVATRDQTDEFRSCSEADQHVGEEWVGHVVVLEDGFGDVLAV